MKIDDHIPKDVAFFVVGVVLILCLLLFSGFTYLGFEEAKHQGLYSVLGDGFKVCLGVVIGVVGGPSAIKALQNGGKRD